MPRTVVQVACITLVLIVLPEMYIDSKHKRSRNSGKWAGRPVSFASWFAKRKVGFLNVLPLRLSLPNLSTKKKKKK